LPSAAAALVFAIAPDFWAVEIPRKMWNFTQYACLGGEKCKSKRDKTVG
jgi:hypothetical protein